MLSEVNPMIEWQKEARGIPAWRGATVVDVRTRERYLCVEEPGDDGCFNTAPTRIEYCYEGVYSADPEDEDPYGVVVDLTDPDTRAAYDRRLALRLGAHPDDAAQGVYFLDDGEHYCIFAGTKTFDEPPWYKPAWEYRTHLLIGEDRLVARAKAWNLVPG